MRRSPTRNLVALAYRLACGLLLGLALVGGLVLFRVRTIEPPFGPFVAVALGVGATVIAGAIFPFEKER